MNNDNNEYYASSIVEEAYELTILGFHIMAQFILISLGAISTRKLSITRALRGDDTSSVQESLRSLKVY